MPNWLHYALWAFWVLWLLNEIHTLVGVNNMENRNRFRRVLGQPEYGLNAFPKVTLILFPVISIFWISWNIWG